MPNIPINSPIIPESVMARIRAHLNEGMVDPNWPSANKRIPFHVYKEEAEYSGSLSFPTTISTRHFCAGGVVVTYIYVSSQPETNNLFADIVQNIPAVREFSGIVR